MDGILPSKSQKKTPTRCIILSTILMMAIWKHNRASETELQTKHIEYVVKIQSN